MKTLKWYIGMWKKSDKDWKISETVDMLYLSVLFVLTLGGIFIGICLIANFLNQ